MEIIKLTADNFEEEVLKADKTVLVDFFATWCGPCKMLSPIVDELASERDDIKVCKVDIDEDVSLALNYKVMSVPTLVVFKNGEVANKSVGLVSKEEIEALL